MTYRARCEGRRNRIRSYLPLRKVRGWCSFEILFQLERLGCQELFARSLGIHFYGERHQRFMARQRAELALDIAFLKAELERRRC